MQSVDPTLLALQTAKTATQNAKKKVLPSLSTQAVVKPSLNVQTQQPQAISTLPTAKVGGISSPLGAPNINSAPILWWATPTEIKETATQLQSLPKAMPETWSEVNYKTSISELWTDISKWATLQEIKQAYPEFSSLDDKVLWELWYDIANGATVEEIMQSYPELQWWWQSRWFVWAVNKFIGDKTPTQALLSPIVRFARWVADVWQWIQEGIDTWLSKIWLLPDQTEANKKARAFDEQMTQWLIGWKWQADTLLQEAWRIGWSMIANAPASKLWTVWKMALWATEWLLWWAAYNVSTGEWVWSPVNLWLSTAIGAAIPWAWALISKIPWAREAISGWLKESARKSMSQALAPTQKKYKQLTERITDDLLDRGIFWSLESMKKTASEWVEKFWAKIDEAIQNGALDNVKIPVQSMKELLKEAKKTTMVWWNIVNQTKYNVIKWLDDMLTPFQESIWWKEARQFKQILDDIVYSTKGGIGSEDLTYKNSLVKWMANSLRWELSKAAPDLAKLNKEFSIYKSLEDVVDATMTRQKPQQWAWRKMWAALFAWSSEWWVVDKVINYIWSKVFLDATSWATRNTISANAKYKLANAIATWSPKVINKVVSEINSDNQLRLPYFPDEVWNTIKTKSVNAPAPLAKTPPITVEKGTIGMWTPKATVLPPKPTVAPSVWEVKTTSNGVISNENKKILTDYLEKHEKARNNYIKSVYETYDWDTAKSYIKERDNKYWPKATQARDALWIKRTKKSSSDVQAESFFKGLQKEQWKTPPAPKWFKWLWKETMEQNIAKTDDLISEAKKYKSWKDMYNNLPYWAREAFDRENIYSLKHFEDFYNNIKDEKIMYRWQTNKWKGVLYNNTNFMWETDWWVFFSPNKADALKYWDNVLEVKSNRWNTVSIDESNKLQKMAQDKVALALKNKSKVSDIIEQMALWRPKSFAKYTGKQFVETWDKFWQEWEMIYYKDLK